MKTLNEIKKRARSVALMYFYSDLDDRTLWEPFEDYPKQWINDEVKNMTETLTRQMLWAQENV